MNLLRLGDSTVARDFRPLVFSSMKPTWAPVSKPKAILNLTLNSLRCSNLKFVLPLYYTAASQNKILSKESFQQ
jgi:hypothetical protein